MRHRRTGRKLGRNPKHQRALLRNLASALILTERDAEFDDNAPKVKGRIITTVAKAKEVRPLVEKCITIARRALKAEEAAAELEPSADRGSEEWKNWRASDNWRAWNEAVAPVVAARRRCLQLLHNKEAVALLFDEIAPRFADRPGGYTRIVRLASPRLGDAGPQAILEFVGVRDRVIQRSEKPAFEDDSAHEESTTQETPAEEAALDTATGEDPKADETAAAEGGEEAAADDGETAEEEEKDSK